MTALRVLEVSTVPMTENGISRFLLRAASAMDRRDMTVDFACFGEIAPGVKRAVEDMGGRLFPLPDRNRRTLLWMLALRRLIRREKYGAVHVHGNSATMATDLWAAKLGGAPVRIAHCHNTTCVHTRLNRLLGPAMRAAATAYVACGEDAGRWLYGSRAFAVLKNGIDTGAFLYDGDARARVRKALGLGDSPVIGAVAGFVPAKNHAFLLNALALCPNRDLKLMLVGEGPLLQETRALADELGISQRVVFTGARSDVPDLMRAMDLAVLPSLHEGFPTVALEWQCAGLPGLVSDRVTRDCDLGGNMAFLPLDARAWATALADAAAMPDGARRTRSERGIALARAQGYDLAEMGQSMRKLYEAGQG